MSDFEENKQPEETEYVPANDPAEEGDSLQISDAVLGNIIRRYTLEVDGVIRFRNQGLIDGVWDMISSRASDRSMGVAKTPDGGIIITVTLVMRFGVRIHEVAKEVQTTLRSKIEELTGCVVKRINVNVSDLEEPPPPPKVEEPQIPENTEDAELSVELVEPESDENKEN